MIIGIAADHGGFNLKLVVREFLEKMGHQLIDFGAYENNAADDYPDFVIPLARAIAEKKQKEGLRFVAVE